MTQYILTALEMQQNSQHWRQKADMGMSRLSRKIETKPLLRLITAPSVSFSCLPGRKWTRDVSTSKERPTEDEIQLAGCSCLVRLYRHIFPLARRTYQSCSRSLGVIIWCVCDIKNEEARHFYNSHRLSTSRHLTWAPQRVDSNHWNYSCSQIIE